MTAIELRFPANRYHGTAWGRHVNEGVAEWPPSPYRLLRALYDVWKRKHAALPDADVSEIFTALAGHPPRFWLPKVVAAHTRSYLSSNTSDPSDKSLIFDAFVAMHPEARCCIEWDITLGDRQSRTLNELLAGLNYLGRSESWIDARLTGARAGQFECKPAARERAAQNIVYVACPVPPSEYAGVPSWFDALAYSSNDLLKKRLSGPPAMRYVPYELTPDAVATWLPSEVTSRPAQASAAMLELHGTVLPMATQTVRIAERIRGRLMRQIESLAGARAIPPILHGKDHQGVPLRDHTHLFILPRANNKGQIDHVLLLTKDPRGFSANPELLRAIVNTRSIRWIQDLRLMAAWTGKADDPCVRPSTRQVVSATPFLTVRHWRKGRGSVLDFLRAEIRRECRNHGLPEPVRIEPRDRIGPFSPSQFVRHRQDDPARPGHAFSLEFAEDVQTPFSLGYGCHFGLGQFEAR